MKRILLAADPQVAIDLRRTSQARRMTLRVSSLDGRVTLTLPARASLRDAERFVQTQSDWILAARAGQTQPLVPRPGDRILVEGRPVVLRAGSGRAARIDGDGIALPPGREGPALKALLVHMARDRLSEAVARHAARLGRKPGRLSLRDPRSRWGSCSAEGNLMFSWRLIMAPPEVLDYVAAHEVAHLAHMDHSPRFWAAVRQLCPGYEPHRLWLRRDGAALHALRFD